MVIELSYYPKIDTTAPLPSTGLASYAPGGLPKLQKTGREVRMGSWKRARVFNWELMFGISSLIFAFMAAGALLIYESLMRAR